MPALIELQNISKSYLIAGNQQTVISNVNFQIQRGELVAIMGASGSGKTTLMNTLGLLDRPTSGNYFINGRDALALSEDERADLRNQTIGFVFQSFFLLPRLTIARNVELPLHYRPNFDKTTARERALTLLKKVGLAHLADQKPNQLSGGQQQRAAIARALVGEPLVILADEPTGSLDAATGKMIMDLFIELNQKDGATIIIVTHDPHIAAQCQRTFKIGS